MVYSRVVAKTIDSDGDSDEFGDGFDEMFGEEPPDFGDEEFGGGESKDS